MRRFMPVLLLLLLSAEVVRGEDRPIPQDPERQQQRFRTMLAWNERTLAGAYAKVGNRDARWDKDARQALAAAARFFSHAVAPSTKIEEVYAPARRALDAGCADPLVLYIYARTSYSPNYPGADELEQRFKKAAVAMESSTYPPFRRGIALYKAGQLMSERKELTADQRKEATWFLDTSLAVLPKSVQEDERGIDLENSWFDLCQAVYQGQRRLLGDSQAAYDRVDAALAKLPPLNALRLQLKGDFLINYAWEARGNGIANSVTEDGWKKFGERLADARKALEAAWEAKPNDTRTASLMLIVEKGAGGERDDMEKWFERAMKADGNNKNACAAKMDWLDPKWHGTTEEMLAFGKACRATKNWRTGITLLAADARLRAGRMLPQDKQRDYFATPEVRDEIKEVYDEYLEHFPGDFIHRSYYAAYCYLCGRYVDSDKHFREVGDRLSWSTSFPLEFMKQARAYVAQQTRQKAPPEKR